MDMVDMISALPDPILHSILSRLPTTEEVIRSSILSTRWRYLWTSIPSIDIDYSRGLMPFKEFRNNKFEEFVCGVLANKSIDLDSFRLCCGNYFSMSTVRRWINAAITRNVKLLDLMFHPTEESKITDVPHCLVNCSSLEVLRLCLFGGLFLLRNYSGFLTIRVLELKTCILIDDDLVKDFLKSSCPLLEDLSLVNCMTSTITVFCISCPKLKNLRIDNRKVLDCEELGDDIDMCDNLEIFCPKLVFLELSGHRELPSESMDTIVCALFYEISNVELLSTSLFYDHKCINLEDLPKSLPNLKTLEITTIADAFNMDVLIRILTLSPNLESLHLIIEKKLPVWISGRWNAPLTTYLNGLRW
ncbi:unnamed protein product [Lactuca virosa]|uniref:F-box domain-containing protein n=1 Tax=Lactuca virosa TaxID=75947 RepID=A0AAU9PE24_9ASTR|nr:unnamed protein product [Lactuca virosa]